MSFLHFICHLVILIIIQKPRVARIGKSRYWLVDCVNSFDTPNLTTLTAFKKSAKSDNTSFLNGFSFLSLSHFCIYPLVVLYIYIAIFTPEKQTHTFSCISILTCVLFVIRQELLISLVSSLSDRFFGYFIIALTIFSWLTNLFYEFIL
jgi:hypothetical protein